MMKKHLTLMVALVLVCGHISAWAGINEDLLSSAEKGDTEEVRRLLDAHADVNTRNKYGFTPVNLAVASGNRKTLELLIAHHANVNAADMFGYTPLHFASNWRHIEIARLLVENGANVNAKNNEGITPLGMAADFLNLHGEPNDSEVLPLPLPSSAEAIAYKEVVELLLAKGALVNAKANDGTTPLHYAAVSGVADVVELLRNNGAEINTRSNEDATPLYLAARYDRKEVAESLLAHGADIESSTRGRSPLLIAALNGNSATAELLLRRGANANIRARQGQPLLIYILGIEHKYYTLTSPILGSLTSAGDKEKLIQWRKSRKGEWFAVARLLIEHGAQVNTGEADSAGMASPLYVAATMGNRELVELLLAKGARVDGGVAECLCETPLHSAIAENHPEVAKLLVEHGANVNALNKSRRTPLHFLAWYMKDKNLAQLMIRKGADVNAREKDGETPYDAAMRAGNREVADVLKRYVNRETGNTL